MRKFEVSIESPGATAKCDERTCEKSGDVYLRVRDRKLTQYYMMCPEHATELLGRLVRIL